MRESKLKPKRCLAAMIAACAFVSPALFAAGAAVVKSQALTDAIRVDGTITDWTTLTAVTEQVSVAAANDQDRITLAIATSDARVKQRLLATGLIVYLDAKGKKDQSFGVRVPPLGDRQGRFGGPMRGGGSPDPGAFGPPPGTPPGPRAITYVEVIGPVANERHIVDMAEPRGFDVAQADNMGTLLIELSIPLHPADDIPFAAQVAPTQKVIGLGLVTPDMPKTSGRPGREGREGTSGWAVGPGDQRGGMGGGIGGGMGGRGGMGGGMRGAGQFDEGKGFKVWTTITLAER